MRIGKDMPASLPESKRRLVAGDFCNSMFSFERSFMQMVILTKVMDEATGAPGVIATYFW